MVIKRVNMAKYFGVTIDEKLTWNSDVEYGCNSLIKFLVFSNIFDTKWPHIQFDNYTIMQNKLLRYVITLDIGTGTNYLHISLNIMKVEDIHTNNVLIVVSICLMGKCPEIFNRYYWVKTTPFETRQEESLDIPSYTIEYGARSIKVVVAKLWNSFEKDPTNINANNGSDGKLDRVVYIYIYSKLVWFHLLIRSLWWYISNNNYYKTLE